MSFLYEALGALPQAAQSPYAFLAYAIVILAWLSIAWRIKRNRQLLKKIDAVPEGQRRDLLLAEMDTPIPPNLSPAEWLASRRQMYFLVALLCLIGATVVVLVIALASPRPAK